MKLMTSWMLAAALVCASGAWAVDLDWVTVGDAGNPNDTYDEGHGGVVSTGCQARTCWSGGLVAR